MSRKLIRLPAVLGCTGDSRTGHYGHIQDGTMVPPVDIGERARAYPDDEIAAIVAARIAGRTNDELRILVRRLVAERAQADALFERALQPNPAPGGLRRGHLERLQPQRDDRGQS